MMKRVCNSRFAMCALLLAVFLLVSGAGAPVCARENISAGQAGDPTDGEGIDSTGSSTIQDGANSNSDSTPAPQHLSPTLIIVVNGVVLQLNIQLLMSRWKSK